MRELWDARAAPGFGRHPPARSLIAAADDLRASGDFDSAYLAYQNILEKDPTNVVARWKLVLCRFGIRYEKDALTGESVPTLSRMRYDSILEDPDFKQVLTASDSAARQEYEHRANAIAQIQERYLDVARNEQPYDVFISFKAEDGGERTRDSVIAQEIYDRLTERGIRTFYSRVTLEDKSGTEYEPYIFAALQSARLMLLVATTAAHVEAPWVKNEWSRFLALMTQDRDKHLLPVYEGMARDEFPQQIPVREALDYAEDGALAEVVQGVLTLTGLGTVVDERDAKTAVARLSESLQSQVEHEQWREARNTANEILDLDAENGDAYFYLLLSEYHVTKPTMLAELDEPWDQSRSFQRAMRYAQPTRQQLLQAVKTRRDMRLASQAEQLAAEVERARKARETEESFEEAEGLIASERYREALHMLQGPAHAHPEAEERISWCRMALKAQQDLSDPTFFKSRMEQRVPGVMSRYDELLRNYKKAVPTMGETEAINASGEGYFGIIIGVAMAVVALLAYLKILPFWPAWIAEAVLGVLSVLIVSRARILTAPMLLLMLVLVATMDYGNRYEPYDKRETFTIFLVFVFYLAAISASSVWRGNHVSRAHTLYANFVTQTLQPLEDQVWADYVAEYEGLGITLSRPQSVIETS